MNGILEKIKNVLIQGIKTGGHTQSVPITLTVAANGHDAGDSLGGSIIVDGAARSGNDTSGVIHSVAIIAEDGIAHVDTKVLFFSADPGAVDDAAFDPSDAILETLMPGAAVLTTANDLVELHDRDILVKEHLSIPFNVGQNNKLYAVIVVGDTITPTETDEFQLIVGVLQD